MLPDNLLHPDLPTRLANLASPRLRRAGWLRMLLGHRILNGLAVGFGLAVLSVLVYAVAGATVAASASVGMLILSIGDQTSPARGKLRQIAPLLWMAAPMSLAVQMAHLLPEYSTPAIGALVMLGGFIGMLGTAWGARGGPLGFALLLAIVFAMSTPPPPRWQEVLVHIAWFQIGAMLYGAYAVFNARVLNTRFRTQALADALAQLATMLRQQGARLASTGDRRENQLRALLSEQAALADKLQTARDLVLDAARTPRQLRLAGMLIAAIRLREQALACELELDVQASRGVATFTAADADALHGLWLASARSLERVCWALFTASRMPDDLPAALDAWQKDAPQQPSPTLRTAADAVSAEMRSLLRFARLVGRGADARSGTDEQEALPALLAQARDWPRFRTSMRWPIAPLRRALSGHSPVMRYAARVSIALGVGYSVALHLPWAAHPHWILLTIAVVMRTNLAQTLERRNARLVGTFIGCVLVTALLGLHPSVPVQFMLLALGAGVAHGFAQVRYLVAATAATVLALIQGHLLHTAGDSALAERLADTVIGTLLAWAFSYVLPAWERRQLPALLKRLRTAQLQHAKVALGGVDLASANADWRLSRREVHDSLAAIATAAQRAQSEPLAVQPPLDLLERLQLRSYRLLAQLGGVRSWREQPEVDAQRAEEVAPLLANSLTRITEALESTQLTDAYTPREPVEALTETVSPRAEPGTLQQRLRDAGTEAEALAADLNATQAWQAARSMESA
ncbi:YccS family putative transporter [soil metagenome]